VAPGPHLIEVAAVLRGSSGAFSYVKEYVFTMRGRLEVTAQAGNVVAVHGRVRASSAATTEWTDRYTLALATAPFTTDRADELEVAAPDAAASAGTRVAAPAPAPRPPPAACSLAPVGFAYGKATLTPVARQAEN
jgi:hypothetical protein